MCNTDIRNDVKQAGLCLWQIANKLGMHDSNFSKLLRKELPTKEKERIRSIIEELSQNQIDEEGSN